MVAWKKPRGRPKRIDPPTSVPGALDRVLIGVVVAVIASRLPKECGADDRSTKDKVRQRILYAVRTGSIHAHGKHVVFGEVIGWARRIDGWGKHLAGLPAIESPEVTFSAHGGMRAAAHATYGGQDAPGRLSAAMNQIAELEAVKREQAAEIERLRPGAERDRRTIERLRQAAKRSRSR